MKTFSKHPWNVVKSGEKPILFAGVLVRFREASLPHCWMRRAENYNELARTTQDKDTGGGRQDVQNDKIDNISIDRSFNMRQETEDPYCCGSHICSILHWHYDHHFQHQLQFYITARPVLGKSKIKTHFLFSLSRRYNHSNNHHHSLSNFQFSIVACWRVALPRGAHTISRGREDTCSAALKPFWTLIFFGKFKAPFKLYLL